MRNKPTGGEGEGFSQGCSGNSDICHFTARKFSGNAIYTLLENIGLILSDNKTKIVYNNDQWSHCNKNLRINTNNSKYYLIENNQLRFIPDMVTLKYMHLNYTLAKELNESDRSDHPMGTNYLSRKDGQLLKSLAQKKHSVYLIKDGKRHVFPNMQTMAGMGYTFGNITLVSDIDIELIPLGDPLITVQ
jgi:hypothetical protein